MVNNSKSLIFFGFILFVGLTIYVEDITSEDL